jgi:hypothetical protein
MGHLTITTFVSIDEDNDRLVLTVDKPSFKYLDFFLRLKCGPRLLASRFYPNSKELSETIGVFDNARIHFSLDFKDPGIAAVVVGDGHVPRTGLYIEALTAWMVHSVDPEMAARMEEIRPHIEKRQRLVVHPATIESCQIDLTGFHTTVLFFVHSHASLKSSLRALKNAATVHAVSLPCCNLDDLGIAPTHTDEDKHILSVHRMLHYYKNIPLTTER